jgi:hypothetical protein
LSPAFIGFGCGYASESLGREQKAKHKGKMSHCRTKAMGVIYRFKELKRENKRERHKGIMGTKRKVQRHNFHF